ncbi:MAG: cyclodeaminase/cyclohydrolase family protein [Firmicutes bacterium]|nr:cyclodeaminase/cyclohydrolase family protein [Bacillota bacterium]
MLVNLKVKDFIAEVASDSPAPGGGSVAALSCSLGAGLISMLANLTVDKKGYEEVCDKMKEVALMAKSASDKFLKVIDADTKAFEAFMDTLKMPKDTDEQKAARSAAMQGASKGITLVPLQLAIDALSLIDTCEYAIKAGNKNATSDGAVALTMLRSGILSAIFNVRINLSGIKDEEFVKRVAKQVDEIEKNIKAREAEILSKVEL